MGEWGPSAGLGQRGRPGRGLGRPGGGGWEPILSCQGNGGEGAVTWGGREVTELSEAGRDGEKGRAQSRFSGEAVNFRGSQGKREITEKSRCGG